MTALQIVNAAAPYACGLMVLLSGWLQYRNGALKRRYKRALKDLLFMKLVEQLMSTELSSTACQTPASLKRQFRAMATEEMGEPLSESAQPARLARAIAKL